MQNKIYNTLNPSSAWTLKVATFIIFFFLGFATMLKADTFVVTTTSSNGQGSFMQALQRANAHQGVDKIVFDLQKGNEFHLIQLRGETFRVSDDLIIDGGKVENGVASTTSNKSLSVVLNTEGGLSALKNITFRGIGYVKNNKLTIQSGANFVFENCIFISNPSTLSPYSLTVPVTEDSHFKNCALEVGDNADPNFQCGTVGSFVKNFNKISDFTGLNLNSFIQKTAKTILNNKNIVDKGLMKLRRDTILQNNESKIVYRLVSKTDTIPAGKGSGDNEQCINGSNVLEVIVSEKTVIVAHPTDITECVGGNQQLTISIVGGTGNITYKWQISTNGIDFTDVGVGQTFTPKNDVAGKKYYRAIIESDVQSCGTITSTAATVVVLDDPIVTIKASKSIICEGETASFSATVTGGTGTPAYQWQKSLDGKNWTDIANANSSSLTVPNLLVTTQYRLKVTQGSGCEAFSNGELVKVGGCSGVIGDFAWLDCNKNGIQDAGEQGIGGIQVSLRGTALTGEAINVNQTTLPNGSYQFKDVKPGKYRVYFSTPLSMPGLAFTQKGKGNKSIDSDPDPDGKSDEFTFGSNEVLNDIDAGFTDDVAPKTTPPSDIIVECDGLGNKAELEAWLLNHGGSTATDNVSTNLIWKHNYSGLTPSCGGSGDAKVTFTVTDDCGNSSTVTANFKIKDTKPPVFTDVPKDLKLNCGEAATTIRTPSVTDACDAAPKIVPKEVREDLCGSSYKITRTWTATDACGNTSTATQIISFEDTDPPKLINIPNGISLSCKDPLPSGAEVKATDNCDDKPQVTMADLTERGACGANYKINRIWTAIDRCGNIAKATQVIIINDNDAPTITGIPVDITVSCGNLIGKPSTAVTANDFCSSTRLSVSDKITRGTCTDQYVVTRTWTATDACGNVAVKSQKITVRDDIEPELIGVPTDLVVNQYQGQTVPVKATVVGTDNCDSRVDVTYNEVKTTTLCGYQLKRTWVGVDNCNNRTTKTQTITVNFSENLAKILSISPENCNDKNGRVEMSPSTLTYTYKWSDGKTGYLRTDLPAGTYNVTATSGPNCAKVIEVNIKRECSCDRPIVSVDKQDVTCDKITEGGSAVINVANGLPADFKFVWTPNISTTNTGKNLAAGNYTVRVERLNKPSCFTEINFLIKDVAVLVVADPTVVPAGCKTPVGSITYTVPVGDSLKFKWASGETTPVLKNLAAGFYTVTITRPNSNVCPLVKKIEVKSDNPMKSDYVINRQPSCSLPNGSVTINTTGGSGNYTYSWGEGSSRFVLPAGPTTVTITDNVTGCFNVISFVLTSTTPQATINLDSVAYTTCQGMTDGRVVYDLVLSNNFARPASAVVSDMAGKLYSNGALAAGSYVLMIKDSAGCMAAERKFQIKDPVAIIPVVTKTNQTCDSLGTISLAVTGGMGSYKYVWSDQIGLIYQPSYRENLKAGFYSVTVSDAAGCQRLVRNIQVKDSCACRPAVVDSVSTIAANCTQSNGKAEIILRGGNETNYSYSWSPLKGVSNTTGNSRTDLPAGIYEVTIAAKINLSCITVVKVAVGSIEGPKGMSAATAPASCDAANGSANLSISSTEAHTFYWVFDGKTAASRYDLKAGSYQVLVSKDAAPDCKSTMTVVVGSKNSLSATVAVKQKPTCGQATGSVAILVVGGSGKYTYSGSTDSVKTGLKSGVYTVTVVDVQTKCQTVVTYSLSDDNGSIANISMPNPHVYLSCAGSRNGRIEYKIAYEAGFAYPAQILITDNKGRRIGNDSLPAGNYCLLVKDATGCLAGSACFEVHEPAKLIASVSKFNKTCDIGGRISLLNVAGGTAPYQVVWSDKTLPANTFERINLEAGSYSVTIYDAKGCSFIIDTIQVKNECATQNACTGFFALGLVENKTCTEGGKITLTSNTGTQPFTYDWADLAGAVNPQNRFGLDAGTYVVTVTDAAGCKSTLTNLTIANDCTNNGANCTPPSIGDISVNDAACGQNNGQINITVLRPANVVYKWLPNVSTTNTAKNLAAGVYKVKICTASDTTCFVLKEIVVKNQDGIPVGQPNIVPATCSAANGKAEFPSLGKILNYAWNDGKNGSSRSDLLSGSYNVTVTDPSGQWCKQVVAVEIPITNGLVGVGIIDKKADCKTANGQASIRVVGGSGSYTYSWGASATKSDLKAGTTNVTVTDNVTGCQAIVTIIMTENVAAFAMVNVSQPVIYLSCSGANDGSVIYNISYSTGFASPARIVMADNLGRAAKNDSLSAGRYAIFVYDKNDCLAGMGNFEVREPSLINVKTSIGAQTCTTKGSISLNVTGGSGIYKYHWTDLTDANQTQNRTDLTAGDYIVVITDSKGCSKSVKCTVKDEALNCSGVCTLTAQATPSPKTCTEGGKIKLTITSGSGSGRYAFSWSDLGTTVKHPQDRINLNPGTYSVTITDSTTNCKFKVLDILIENHANGCPSSLCKITAYADVTDKSCTEGGSIKVSGMTGRAPHKFDWLDLPGNDNPQNRFNLLAGSYTLIVSDSVGCKDTISVSIKDKCTINACVPPVIANMTTSDATCFQNNGTIALTMSDAASYKFTWSPNASSSNAATSLLAGTYKIKIARASDTTCFIEKSFIINNKNENLVLGTPTVTDAGCGASNGSITVNGQDTWVYTWNDGKTGKTRNNIPAGNYIVTVTDPSVSGCPVIQEIAVKAISNIQATIRIDKKPTCGASNGQATITVTGGSGNYNFSWGTAASRSNLKAGSYTVIVTDNQTGCTATVSLSLTEDLPAIATITIPNPTLTLNCRGDQNGRIDYTVSYAVGFAQPAAIKVVDELGNTVNNGKLQAGKYKVIVTDAGGCIAGMGAFTVVEPDMIVAKAIVKPADCNTLGTITLNVTGGAGGYVFDWDDVQGVDNPRDKTGLNSGLYSVFIKDNKGCTVALKNIAVANNCAALQPKKDTVYKTIFVNRTDTVCMPIDRALIGQGLTYSFCDGFISKGTTVINNNGCITYKAGSALGRDEYCVKACNSLNLCDTTIVFITVIPDPNACLIPYTGSPSLSVSNCVDSATICTNVPYKFLPNYKMTVNGKPTIFSTLGCKQDTVYTYAYFTLIKFYPVGPWDLDSWTVNGQVFKGRIPSIQALVDSMNRWDPFGDWALDAKSNNIIGGDNRRIYGNMNWKRNGRNVATFQVNKQFVPSVLSVNIPVGQHKLVFTDTVKGCKDSITVTVACNVPPLKPGSYTIDTVLFVGKRDNYCLNNSPWASQTTIRNICVGSYKGYASYSIDDNFDCVRVIGVSIGRDTLCLKRCYANGVCDTVRMIISVKPLTSESDTACIKAYTGLNYFNVPCGSRAQMCTNLQGTDTLNYLITLNGKVFKNGYTACSADTIYAYTYFSLTLTNPTGPWKLDGWIVNGKTYSGIIPSVKALVDSMNRWDVGGNWRLESTSYAIKGGKAGSNYGNMTWYKNGTSTKIASLGPNRQLSIKQIGMLLDPGRHQIIFKNILRGCSDTANVLVECRQLRTRPSMTLKDTTIYVGTTYKYCLPTNGLLAVNTKLTPLSNIKGYISYVADDATDCVTITGENIGQDVIAMQRCDFDGECDTVKLTINVIKKPALTTETIFHTIKLGRDSSYCVKTDELKGTRFTTRNICERNATNNVNFIVNGTCVTYTADLMGLDTACLVTCDELGSCDTTRLIVYVINERQTLPAPVAVNDRATTPKATKVNITPIINDTVFGLPSEIIILTKPAHGSIIYDEATKIVTYQPEGMECVGIDTFSYALVTMGGRDTAYIKVEVMCDEVVVFSGFSPNEDGVNDTFTILGLEKYPNHKLFVFNRTGNQVFTSDNYKNEWNAVSDGIAVPDGTYFYVLDLGNGKKLSGYVQIHR